jgi:hypothetical protein
MKKIIITLSIIAFTVFGCSKDDTPTNTVTPIAYKSVQKRLNENETPLSIYTSGVVMDSLYGKSYKGGLIYYLNATDGTGLVAHTQDNSSSVNWGGFGDVTGANSTIIGSGITNSYAIMSYFLNTDTAADFCDNLVLNNYSDWFLPSKDEMLMMITKLKNKPNVYFSAVSGYWTSSNYDFNNAWIIRSDNTPITFLKYNSIGAYDIRIRATRKF